FDDELWKKVAGLSLQEAQSVIDDLRKEGSDRFNDSQEYRQDRLASADSSGTNEWVIPSSPVDFLQHDSPRIRPQDGQYLRNDRSTHRSTSCAPSASRAPNQ